MIAGDLRKVAGNQAMVAGDSRKVAGNQAMVAGDSRKVAGNQTIIPLEIDMAMSIFGLSDGQSRLGAGLTG